MREALVDLILTHCKSDLDSLFMTGDLGFSVVEPLQCALGDRFINAGVAEQNMMTMAAALADTGYVPYVYSIAPFVTARCYEQIRNDVCYHKRPVIIVGVGAGLSYGSLGPSHHSLEDAALLATLPGMRVLSPANAAELAEVHRLTLASPGPTYIRVSRESGRPFDVPQFSKFDEAAHRVADGSDICIVGTGPAVTTALDARTLLAERGISACVVSVPVLAPFPAPGLKRCLPGAVPVLSIFEGYVGGPLELGLRRLLMEEGTSRAYRDIAIGLTYPKQVGSTEFLRHSFGIDADAAAAVASEMLGQ
ncbi:transketolase C-terminal domain-containing protein [Hyphomicrobium sp. D-2]|uniref:transketolase family protein n=1 Tax=Hyphomicrobium sp. D-2 TaxID=3041621 RepID=UPI0024572B75|nr:transketolase C-terminal domain-containing protein [Hyphomicrobium sp. D-2]MDH4981860.1 transketolase C-terminal domain-containing protein [Hyphomicrobium sp. D-2]